MRTLRKIETMWNIYQTLPSTFVVIQSKTKLSSRTVAQRLKELEELGVVEKNYNLYVKVPEEKWSKAIKVKEWSNEHNRFLWVIFCKMNLEYIRKKRGASSKKITKSLEKELNRFIEEHLARSHSLSSI